MSTDNIFSESFFARTADAIIKAMMPVLLRQLQKVAIQPRLVDYRQAAIYVGRSYDAFRHLVVDGAFPIHRYDGKPMVDIRDLDVWIENHKAKS